MKTKTVFNCQKCGYQSPRWLGRCPDCSSWNSLAEEMPQLPQVGQERIFSKEAPVLLGDISLEDKPRISTRLAELDRVLGGGLVSGSVVLLGGDPGIGKSTIALQAAINLSKEGRKVLYISAEESLKQTKLRAVRIDKDFNENLFIVSQTNLEEIIKYIKALKAQVVFLDSIQVVYNPAIASSTGTITQVRECAGTLTQLAKLDGFSLILIGHVTKEGTLAGPKLLEHIVDTVLYFEGDKLSLYRILRTAKNRFGSTNEIGLFAMTESGLQQVSNPSQIFLSQRARKVSGSIVVAIMEGSRPLLIEIQALVSRAGFNIVRRRCQGIDYNRFLLLVAVLEKRLGLPLGDKDIFVNVAGGIVVDDPAADLGMMLAIASSLKNKEISSALMIVGEVGLSAEVRSISNCSLRIKEALKLGFTNIVIPESNIKEISRSDKGKKDISFSGVKIVKDAMQLVF
ncbi:MAG: DNA repair protein RadA [Candidatus Omnitrophica bacterium]|nr:DNA repair protein RadA [Candidatus Omnitrophota bacterium]